MSDPVNQPSQRPAPDALTPTPPFKKEGLLPRTPDEVAAHYRKQFQPKLQAAYAAERQAAEDRQQYVGPPCIDVLDISLCFDGTNNHEPSDKRGSPPSTSNVARLYHASLGPENNAANNAMSDEGFYRYYIQGVGTEFKEIGEFEPDESGLKTAVGGENRINWGLTRLLDAVGRACGESTMAHEAAYALVQQMGTSVMGDMLGASLFKDGYTRRRQALQAPLLALQKKVEYAHARKTIPRIIAIRLWVYGFSRGAAAARAFANWLEALTQIEVEGETCYLFAGIPISIAFLGLFDTVASVGVAYVAPFAAGHMGWADDSMRLTDSQKFLERCVHLVSAHEQRACFPVDSIRRKANPDDPNCASTYRAGTVEYLYPGVHSDVGGGYPPGDQGKALGGTKNVLSQISLNHMYAEAYAVGAPLQVPKDALSTDQKEKWPWLIMETETVEAFNVSETLTHRFNTWLAAHENGPLEKAMDRQIELLTAWRIQRYHCGVFKRTSVYQHVLGKDMTDEERGAFKALHARQLAENKANHEGQPLRELSGTTLENHQRHLAIKQAYEQRIGAEKPIDLNTQKAFEPLLDQRQLDNAMIEFSNDYNPGKWPLSWDGDAQSWATLAHVTLGGLLYMTNEQDEADDYIRMRRGGHRVFNSFYEDDTGNAKSDSAQIITDFFDDQVHDSRAWFMNAVLGERELFSDYFRYRCIFFDNESNKPLSPLVTTEQVIGVAIAVASVGLSIKRHDPRYLIGLIAPSLGIPVFRGKIGAPQVSAFDTATKVALPMLDNIDKLRAFTSVPGDVMKIAKALPAPPALTAETATTPDLQKIFKAAEEAKAVAQVKALLDNLPGEEKLGLLAQVKGMVGGASA